MFKRLDPRDINITPFKAYKQFTVTNVDSGSGIYALPITKGTDATQYGWSIDDSASKTISASVFFAA